MTCMKKIPKTICEEELGKLPFDYLEYLEAELERLKEPEICRWIKKMFNYSFERQWYKTYWAFDLHGVIIEPHKRGEDVGIKFYPYAKELLQLVSKRDDIIMFTYTSSYPDEMEKYKEIFLKNDINFDYFNENPEISDKNGSFGYYKFKPYYNVLFEDKAGFKPSYLKDVYELMVKFEKDFHMPLLSWK